MRKWLKHLKNQKGLTLIELLAVVVILGIIAAIAVPAIGNIIDNSKQDAHRANALLIINSTKLGIVTGDITSGHITLTELVTAGVLDGIPSNPSIDGEAYNPETSYVNYVAATNSIGATYKITLKSVTGTVYFNEKSESEVSVK